MNARAELLSRSSLVDEIFFFYATCTELDKDVLSLCFNLPPNEQVYREVFRSETFRSLSHNRSSDSIKATKGEKVRSNSTIYCIIFHFSETL